MKNEILYAMSDWHDLQPKKKNKRFNNAYYCDFCPHNTLATQLI